MNDAENDDQRRDAMLLRALKTPPQPRPKRDRSKPSHKPTDDASEKRAG
jgi:hypothetical protein